MPISTPAHSKTTDPGKCACGWVSPKLGQPEKNVTYSLGQHIARQTKKDAAAVATPAPVSTPDDVKEFWQHEAEEFQQVRTVRPLPEPASIQDEAADKLAAKRAKNAERMRKARAAKKLAAGARSGNED